MKYFKKNFYVADRSSCLITFNKVAGLHQKMNNFIIYLESKISKKIFKAPTYTIFTVSLCFNITLINHLMCKTTKCEGNIKKISLEMNLNNFGKLEKNVVVDLHNNFY